MVGVQIFVIKHFGADLQNDQLFPMNESHVRATEAVMDYLGLISTINLPLYALSGYLTYKNLKQYNFTEHLIFSSYIWGFYNIVTTIFTLPIIFLPSEFGLLTLLPVPLSIFHIFYGYHRIFNLSWGRSVLKAFIYLIISSIQFFILFVFLVVIIVFVLLQFFPEYLESIKAFSNGSSL